MKFICALLLLSLSHPLQAQTRLHIGDVPPALNTVEWIRGAPVTTFEEGQTYLVLFSSTWCPPCEAAIPRMNEIQQRFRDRNVQVLGLAARERGETVADKRIELTNFLSQNHGVPIEYTVGFDGSGVVASEWMDAAAIFKIPSLFVVNSQRHLVYIDHPLNLTDEILEQILNGTWDPSSMKSDIDDNAVFAIAGQAYNQRFSAAVRTNEWKTALQVAQEAIRDANVEHPQGWFFKKFGIYNEIGGWPATLRRMNGDITYRWESYDYLRLILMWLGNAYSEVPSFAQTATSVPERLIFRLDDLIQQGRTEQYGGITSDVLRLSADILHAINKPSLALVYEQKFSFATQIEQTLEQKPIAAALSGISDLIDSRILTAEQHRLVGYSIEEYIKYVGEVSPQDRSTVTLLVERLQDAPHACHHFVK